LSDRSSEPAGTDDGGEGQGVEASGSPSGSPDRRAWLIVGALAVAVVVLGVWLWAAGGDDAEDIAGTDYGSTITTSSSTSTTTTGSEGSDTSQSTLADEDPDGITVPEGASTDPVHVPSPAIEVTGLTAVRAARHEGFDRVVFEFDGAVPGYEVRYADKPVTEDGSGNEVTVDGPYVVTVRMTPASAVRFTDDGYEEIYTGPDRVPGQGATVTEVVEVGDFEGQATWAVGLADKVDFAVSTLESPSRLVIDFVNH
jgi:hypothetical protein